MLIFILLFMGPIFAGTVTHYIPTPPFKHEPDQMPIPVLIKANRSSQSSIEKILSTTRRAPSTAMGISTTSSGIFCMSGDASIAISPISTAEDLSGLPIKILPDCHINMDYANESSWGALYLMWEGYTYSDILMGILLPKTPNKALLISLFEVGYDLNIKRKHEAGIDLLLIAGYGASASYISSHILYAYPLAHPTLSVALINKYAAGTLKVRLLFNGPNQLEKESVGKSIGGEIIASYNANKNDLILISLSALYHPEYFLGFNQLTEGEGIEYQISSEYHTTLKNAVIHAHIGIGGIEISEKVLPLWWIGVETNLKRWEARWLSAKSLTVQFIDGSPISIAPRPEISHSISLSYIVDANVSLSVAFNYIALHIADKYDWSGIGFTFHQSTKKVANFTIKYNW